MRFDRRLAIGLLVFLALFVVASTAALVRLQGGPGTPPPRDLLAVGNDIHTLISGSLLLAGLHPEDLVGENMVRREEGPLAWNEYESELLVGEDFPLRGWLDGLRASLERAGASLSSVDRDGRLEVRITLPPAPGGGELLLETLSVALRSPPARLARRSSDQAPRASIVIDDLGQNPEHLRRLAALKIPLTVSVLPGLPYSRSTAQAAADAGMEVLLHLPMEPLDFPEKHPGPGALLEEMTEEQIRAQLAEDLESLPGVSGVNNHMGSRLTTDRRVMEVLMEELGARHLFFLDSRTSPRSLAFETAFRAGLPAARRDIFLDAHDDKAFIRGQLARLLELTRRDGAAIGIGHPYDSTLEVLEEMHQELLDSGIEWVPLSDLLLFPGGLEARRWEP